MAWLFELRGDTLPSIGLFHLVSAKYVHLQCTDPSTGYDQEAVDRLIEQYRRNAPSYRHTPDAQLLPRLVGYYEYQAAMACFEAIVLTSRAGHLDAIQSWLEQSSDLPVNVEINLSTEVVKPAPSALDPRQGKQLRRGLPWMMATAQRGTGRDGVRVY